MALSRKFDFGVEVLDVPIGGKSMIDLNHSLTGFSMTSVEDADRFLRCYGFDLENPIEMAEAQGNFQEAINFVRKYFLKPENPDGLALEIPRKILEITDLRELLVMASSHQGGVLREWACSLLKVIHSLAHIDKDVRSHYFSEIQKQILDRFYKVIRRDSKEHLFLGESADDPLSVPLVHFETKPKKTRESVLLKLLHKAENVGDEVFDRVGVRLVTHDALDAIRAIKFLKDSMIIMPANIKPSRSRNSLFDLEFFRKEYHQNYQLFLTGKIKEPELAERLLAACEKSEQPKDNPHSSKFYRAIQFTCRQLIRLKNPIHDSVRELKAWTKTGSLPSEVAHILESMDMKYIQKEMKFFYPYEVQVLDKRGFDESSQGRATHSEYKSAQIKSALHRVMGNLIGM